MNKKVIICLILIVLVPVIINEIYNRPKYNLISDAEKILNNVDNYVKNSDISLEEILIDNKYTLNKDTYKVSASGIVIIDEGINLLLSKDNMCVIKLSDSDMMFQKEKCPEYRMFNGIKEKIVSSGSGLYKENDKYVYKGKNSSNLLIYNEGLYYILEIDDNYFKIVSLTNISEDKLTNEEYSNTFSEGSFLTKDMIGNKVIYLSRNSLIKKKS